MCDFKFLFCQSLYVIEKKPSLVITICHHSGSLVMPNSDHRDSFFYPIPTLMMDSYNIILDHFYHRLSVDLFPHFTGIDPDQGVHMIEGWCRDPS